MNCMDIAIGYVIGRLLYDVVVFWLVVLFGK